MSSLPRLLQAAFACTALLAAPALHATTHHRIAAASEATPSCQYKADEEAFEVEGLKSQLMVTALACKQQNKYNAFMSRFQPDVAREERTLTTYFKRAYGRGYQKAYDAYITNLADIQEQDGLKAGTAFCDNLPAMFSEVLALQNDTELPEYANAKAIMQPISFQTCAAEPATIVAHKHTRARFKHS